MILLDTNVLSEPLRAAPDPAVMDWLRVAPPEGLWTSTVVVAELFSGVDLMLAGKRQRLLRENLESMVATLFAGRLLAFDLAAARAYGAVLSIRQQIGRPIAQVDAMIAATALSRGATLATRNTRDFEHCGIELVNPWLAEELRQMQP